MLITFEEVNCFIPQRFIRMVIDHREVGPISLAIFGNISIIETSFPLEVRNSAVSQPIIPPPIITTLSPVSTASFNTSTAKTTFFRFIPGRSGVIGFAPVAMITSSAFSFNTVSGVAVLLSIIFTFNFFI